jgi:hypothetical protein
MISSSRARAAIVRAAVGSPASTVTATPIARRLRSALTVGPTEQLGSSREGVEQVAQAVVVAPRHG